MVITFPVEFFLSFLNSGELPAFQGFVKHTKIFRSSVITQIELILTLKSASKFGKISKEPRLLGCSCRTLLKWM